MRKTAERFAVLMGRDMAHGRRDNDEVLDIMCTYASAHYPNDTVSRYLRRVDELMAVVRREHAWWMDHPQLLDRDAA